MAIEVDTSTIDLSLFKERPSTQWDALVTLASKGMGSVTLTNTFDPQKGQIYTLSEHVGEYRFEMIRYVGTSKRLTSWDQLGLIGLGNINTDSREVLIAEGVSDYQTLYHCFPHKNVLGTTTIGGNKIARAILLSLFDKFTIVADNDYDKQNNVGMSNAQKLAKFLKAHNKEVAIEMPEAGFKDITQQFMMRLKLALYKTL